jgi:capsular exopolysaccharide synthesis family protein
VTIVGIGLGVGLTLLTTKVYQANTQIFASSSSAGVTDSSNINNSNTFLAARVQSYTEFATSPQVLKEVLANPTVTSTFKDKHRTALSQQELASKISADAPLNKVLINLHVTDVNPYIASTLANALAKAFNLVVPNTEQGIPTVNDKGKVTGSTPAVQLEVIHPATVPSTPVKPNKVLNIGLGIVLGLLIGIGVAVVREVLDNTVKGAKDFEEMGVPLLAQVAFDKRAVRSPIAFRGDAHSARSEAYRQLRTNLQFVDVDNPPRIIAVTSAVPGEGKSMTAINLAAALAEAGGRVCLIEADLRRPSIAKALGLVSDVGFTTVVIGKAPVETVLQNAGKNLAVLTCGPIPPNPSELLISQHAKQVIFDIAEKVDFVIIDTPPLLPVTDGAEIATIADATLLVHRAAKTTRDQAIRSIQALEKVGKRPVGVILNMVTRGGGGGRYDYEYGYYYSAYRPSKDATPAATTVKEAAAPATVDSATDTEKAADAIPADTNETLPDKSAKGGRRARHRGAKRAAAEQAAATAAATAAADTDSFTPVDKAVPKEETPAEPSTDDALAPVDAEDVPAEAEPVAQSVDQPVGIDDEFADEYDEYDDYDELGFAESRGAAPGVADDDTVEFGAVEVDGQEQLPLNERINGVDADVDDHSFDEALGVKGERR